MKTFPITPTENMSLLCFSLFNCISLIIFTILYIRIRKELNIKVDLSTPEKPRQIEFYIISGFLIRTVLMIALFNDIIGALLTMKETLKNILTHTYYLHSFYMDESYEGLTLQSEFVTNIIFPKMAVSLLIYLTIAIRLSWLLGEIFCQDKISFKEKIKKSKNHIQFIILEFIPIILMFAPLTKSEIYSQLIPFYTAKIYILTHLYIEIIIESTLLYQKEKYEIQHYQKEEENIEINKIFTNFQRKFINFFYKDTQNIFIKISKTSNYHNYIHNKRKMPTFKKFLYNKLRP